MPVKPYTEAHDRKIRVAFRRARLNIMKYRKEVSLPAVGIFIDIRLDLDLSCHVEKLAFIFQTKLFENDGHLPWVGTLKAQLGKLS